MTREEAIGNLIHAIRWNDMPKKEALEMAIQALKTCGTCKHFPNDKHCVGCVWDEAKGENTKWELKENPIGTERAVLDKIRAEIIELPTISLNANDVYKAQVLQIIDKYKAEIDPQERSKE